MQLTDAQALNIVFISSVMTAVVLACMYLVAHLIIRGKFMSMTAERLGLDASGWFYVPFVQLLFYGALAGRTKERSYFSEIWASSCFTFVMSTISFYTLRHFGITNTAMGVFGGLAGFLFFFMYIAAIFKMFLFNSKHPIIHIGLAFVFPLFITIAEYLMYRDYRKTNPPIRTNKKNWHIFRKAKRENNKKLIKKKFFSPHFQNMA